MLSSELKSIHAALGCVLARVDVESAELVRLCRRNLASSAEMAETLEKNLVAPPEASSLASCLMDRPPLAREMRGDA